MDRHPISDRAVIPGSHHHRGDPTEYTPEELAFMTALDEFKREHNRPHPTCCEVLKVLKSLGYERRADCREEGK